MRKLTFIALAALSISSCNSTRIMYDDTTPSDGNPPSEGKLWATAISFPEGYDWMKDSLGGNVGSKILLFHGTEAVLSLDGSKDGPILPDGDMHLFADGHLFSQFPSMDGYSEVFRDGVSLFRHEGREFIEYIHVLDDDVYTLGTCMETEGWSFRKNGTLVYGQNKGRLLSGLYEDEGRLCFAWGSPLVSGSGKTAWRYYIMAGNEQRQVLNSSDINEIYSIRRFRGEVHFLAGSSILDELLWENGSGGAIIDGSSASALSVAELFVAGDRLAAHLKMKKNFSSFGMLWQDFFYRDGKLILHPDPGMQTCSSIHDMDCLAIACSANGGTDRLVLLDGDGKSQELSENFFMVSPEAFCCDGSGWSIGLNDRNDKRRPLIIHGADTSRYDFNGYFTCLSLP